MRNGHLSRWLTVGTLVIGLSAHLCAEPSSGFAVGAHGPGDLHTDGLPQLTWVLNQSNSLDFSPSAWQRTSSPGGGASLINRYGLRVAERHRLGSFSGLRLNAMLELGYERDNDHFGAIHNITDILDVSVGPDFEYFIPAYPQLSVGASLLLRAGWKSARTYTPGSSARTENINRTVGLHGEGLSLRYYFNGDADSKSPAPDDSHGRWGLGVHGLGTLYARAAPLVVWNWNDRNGLELTPTIFAQHIYTSNNYRTDENTLGGFVDWTHLFLTAGGLRVGSVLEGGFTRDANGDGSGDKFHTDTYVIGIGPDVEYFFPRWPQLSVGARSLVRYTYQEYIFSYQGNLPVTTKYFTRGTQIVGEGLTVRYRFGGSSKD